jgi:SAM-dependent methyltransferase
MKMDNNLKKLNIGAGTDIRPGYINHDLSSLEGIDCVHDLNVYPWPWADGSFEEVIANDVLEHLDDFMRAMEELHRILSSGGKVKLTVPYWNSYCAHADPTHRRGFHELTFRFFDPTSPYCQERPYYTKARFNVAEEAFILVPFSPYFQLPFVGEIIVRNRIVKRLTGWIGNHISNVILAISLTLEKI